jgi:hypothetical protein
MKADNWKKAESSKTSSVTSTDHQSNKIPLNKIYKEEFEIYDVKQEMIKLKKRLTKLNKVRNDIKSKLRFSNMDHLEVSSLFLFLINSIILLEIIKKVH